MGYYSAIKKSAVQMNLENTIHSAMSEKDNYPSCDVTYMWNLKNNTTECMLKTNRPTDIENKLMITKEKRKRGGTNQGYGINGYKLLYMK